jgi:phosphohistidine phosphatase
MKLILIRHADAVAKGENGSTRDFDRPLTDQGREQAKKLADTLAVHGVKPNAVVTSPLVRAVQTAEPLLALLTDGPHQPVACSFLAPDYYRPKKLSKFLNGLGGEVLCVVGHNPPLSEYAAWLLGAYEGAVELEKGAACLVAFEEGVEKGSGRLGWMITPAWFMAEAVV